MIIEYIWTEYGQQTMKTILDFNIIMLRRPVNPLLYSHNFQIGL